MIQPDPHEVEPHLDQPEPQTVTQQLARVLARSDADLSATETLKLEVDRHASLATLLAEYDVLAHAAQVDQWTALLDAVPFPANVADDVFTSPYYDRLEAALARHQAAGHDPATILNALVPSTTPGEDQVDPAALLATRIDQATAKLGQRRITATRRVAGLIPVPAGPVPGDMRTALTERQRLIETAVRQLLQTAIDAGEAWTTRMGRPPTSEHASPGWFAHATTIALYRRRYDITGPVPLGNPKDITNPGQASEYRVASSALRRARQVAEASETRTPRRQPQQVEYGRQL